MILMAQLGGTPILILKAGTERRTGKSAKEQNFAAAMAIAEIIKSSLGPKGMSKLLVDNLGDITISNDGKTILDEIEVEHPAAKMMVEIAKTQYNKVGDGTSTSVILAGELLKKAQSLLDQDIHPNIIFHGYRLAIKKAEEILEKIGKKVDFQDKESFKKVARTSMNSKNIGGAQEKFAEIAMQAIMQIKNPIAGGYSVDLDDVQIIKKSGKSIQDSELIYGLIVDKEVVHSGMPKRIPNAKIAVIDAALEIEKTEFTAEVRVKSPAQLQTFMDQEEKMLKDMTDKIIAVGANAIFCQKGIDDTAQDYLAKAGVLSVRRVKRSDMEKLTRATGARLINRIEDLTPESLGTAEIVEEGKVGKDNMIFITGCKDPKAVSILVRGSSTNIVEEANRSMHDALCAVRALVEDPISIAGGGASLMEISKQLRVYATTVGGKEQLSIESYAEALETIPRVLAENGGMDPVEILAGLRAKHEKSNGTDFGLELFSQKIVNMFDAGIIEPRSVLLQALHSATEVACMIVKIDDVIVASKLSKGPKMPGKEHEIEE